MQQVLYCKRNVRNLSNTLSPLALYYPGPCTTLGLFKNSAFLIMCAHDDIKVVKHDPSFKTLCAVKGFEVVKQLHFQSVCPVTSC